MRVSTTYLSHFHSIRPRYTLMQADALKGLVNMRLQLNPQPDDWTREIIETKIRRFGLGGEQIDSRGSEVSDYSEGAPNLFRNGKVPSLGTRMDFFRACTSRVMNEFYETELKRPNHLVHVTCTGYVAPNAAQELAAKWRRDFGQITTVTNAYHMGCYAALPAIRIAQGLNLTERVRNKQDSQVDIIHQELCSLHFDPLSLEPEQIVVQSLFADGHIRYSVVPELHEAGFAVMALREELIPGTLEDMAWAPGSTHFAMHLSREVPVKIKHALRDFVSELLKEAHVPDTHDLIFAIHPGGPKIIEAVEKELELGAEQTTESHDVFRNHGNMSSATLPHIWQKILQNPLRAANLHVVSLAFGPGLTLSGGVFQLCRH